MPYELTSSERNLAVATTINSALPLPLIGSLREGPKEQKMDSRKLGSRELDMDITSLATRAAIKNTLTQIGVSLLERYKTSLELNAILGGRLVEDSDPFIEQAALIEKTTQISALFARLAATLGRDLIEKYTIDKYPFLGLGVGNVVVSEFDLIDPAKIKIGRTDRIIRVGNIDEANGIIIDESYDTIKPGLKEEFILVDEARDLVTSVNHALTRGGCLLALAGRLKALHQNLLGI